ncbi:hypothetical protein [Mesohalobacter halotolerans]|uniref:Uncharacterized protein n=1 Tax=Mesohalobacter halotolerans TaxID=1883405 RepID=A0A4U5TS28_9FLAO|nr:hypothetical protein [Mesohalobacter halotolerans]MBS3738097.1 hypothetical protein [Psychroflexus sp.]TKS57090.1 hypothetical protein FCN74_01350 [Mesohalobacter halotolerans]
MKRLILSAFVLFLSLSMMAQIKLGSEGTFANKWHEGKLVLKNKDTLVGLVKFDDASDDLLSGISLSNKLKFKENEEAKKKKFKKKQVDYFEITNNANQKNSNTPI